VVQKLLSNEKKNVFSFSMPDSLYGVHLQGITVVVLIKPCTRLSNNEYNYSDSLQACPIE